MSEARVLPIRTIGRYAMYREIASGGMASVHFGRLVGPVGFARTIALKRLHPQYAKDPEFVAMFLDEARLVSRIRHPNVVQTLDVVPLDGELFIVMEYVHGESLSRLLKATTALGTKVPVKVAAAVMSNALHGLHAAHEAKDAQGRMLGIVHRDVSPHNVMVGTDGIARVLDFGVAFAAGRMCSTSEGQIKGKIAYMSPEQLNGEMVDRLTDVYAASVVLWELLTGRRLFDADNQGQLLERVLKGTIEPPSRYTPNLPPPVEEVVMRGLARDPYERWATAREMAVALERSAGVATPSMVGGWVESVAGDLLAERAAQLAIIEHGSISEDELTPSSVSARLVLATPPPLPPAARRTIESARPTPTPASGFPSNPSLRVTGVEIDPRASALPSAARSKRAHVLLAIALSCGVGVLLGGYMLAGTVSSGAGSRSAARAPLAAAPEPSARPETVALPAHAGDARAEPPGLRPTASRAQTAAAGRVPTPPASPARDEARPAHAPGTTPARAPETTPARAPETTPARPAAIALPSSAAAASVASPAPPPAHAPVRPSDACNPPFTIDAVGHKKYKLECL